MNRWILGLLLLSAALLAGGCGGEEHGAADEIVLAAARDLVPGPKEPYYCSAILKVWEPLVALSDEGAVSPLLAERWEANEDKTAWTFYLKRGVMFHDGTVFDADAVLKNFVRMRGMAYKPSNFYGFRCADIYPGLTAVEKVDDYAVRLFFAQPVPMLVYRMAGWGSAMFSPASFRDGDGDFIGHAQGTGPFRIVDWQRDDHVLLERFAGYHGLMAKAQCVRVRVIPAAEVRYSALKSGEIQGVLDLGSLPPMLAEELVKDGGFQVDAIRSTISHFLTVNGTRFPFSDERMRLALNLAIDRESIVRHYFRGYGFPTMNFLNRVNPFARSYPLRHDREEAQRLARAVLGEKRQRIRFLLSRSSLTRYPYKVIAEYLQAELRPLGLDMEIVMADTLAARQMKSQGDFDLTIAIRGLGHQDPTLLLYDYFDSAGATNRLNRFGYANAEVDGMFDALEEATDLRVRADLYGRIQEALIRQPAVIPLLEDVNLAVSSRRITGYRATVYGVTLEEMAWKEGTP